MSQGEARAVLQLGEDHLEYGSYSCGRLSEDCAWAISVGAYRESPSLWAKGDPEFTNEDGLLLLEQGPLTLMAVADAHFGRESSHVLLTELRELATTIPADPPELAEVLRAMARREPMPEVRGGTSLLVAVYDHDSREGFGASFWDSTFAVVGVRGVRHPVAHRTAGIVHLAEPAGLDPLSSDAFFFTAEEGDLLLAYTDGIDCCNYDTPETSVTPEEMAKLYAATGGDDAERYLRALVELALAGVNGHPGGEDNIAAIAVRA